jgi:hypothetical protein
MHPPTETIIQGYIYMYNYFKKIFSAKGYTGRIIDIGHSRKKVIIIMDNKNVF